MGLYVEGSNPTTGKELRERFKAGETIRVYQPGPFGPDAKDGREVVQMPKYPQPHRAYVAVEVKDGVIVKIYK